MAKRPRWKADLADRLCDAVKHLAAERSSRSHGAQWIMLHDVARHLGISDDEAQRAVVLAVERGWRPKKVNAFGWAELNARGVEKDVTFYERVFGWTPKRSPVPGGSDYIEFQIDGDSIAGATEIDPKMSSQVPSHWLVYFSVDDVDTTFQKALQLGAREIVAPQSYEGGQFAIVTDPQGAQFGLYKSSRR